MGWQKVVQMRNFRQEVLRLGEQGGTNIRKLCRGFRISPKTYYKWRKRYQAEGVQGLENQSRRPLGSPRRSARAIEEAVLEVRREHQQWGARKIQSVLRRVEVAVPARSTIHDMLKRNGCINEQEAAKHRPWQRFEKDAPNQLWQMDFKGWSEVRNGCRCQPLTIVDDHSRYAVCLQACENQQTATVQHQLSEVFRRYGLPERMIMDNGSPWGYDDQRRYTPLTAWLIRLGIGVSHSRPYHPQTQGKVERFHRTLQQELLEGHRFTDRAAVQEVFDRWRDVYNQQRPHEALNMQVPASRYRISRREFPEKLPAIEYDVNDQIRRVDVKGHIQFGGRRLLVGKGFRGYPVALRTTAAGAAIDVFFCKQKIAQIDLSGMKSPVEQGYAK